MEINRKIDRKNSELSDLVPSLEVHGLCFSWPSHQLFWEYDFTVGVGITWLRGSNGVGKTTLLKLLAGAIDAQRGEVRLNQIDQVRDAHAWRLQTYLCSGETPNFSWLSVQDFFDLHLSLYPLASAQEINRHVYAFALLPILSQTIANLSLGQHKKIHLALALALPVKLLLIDEPFNALDAEAAQYLRTQFHDTERLRRQCILMTSHVIPDVPLVGEMVVGS